VRPTVGRPVPLGVRHPFGAYDQFLISCSKITFLSSLRRAPSLTRGRVCNLHCSHSVVRVAQIHNLILLSHLRLPQPGGPGPRIYIPQEQGGPVIPPGTGFSLRRLLRLAGLRWRYCNTPPHRSDSASYTDRTTTACRRS
jgi:hypothetical protein